MSRNRVTALAVGLAVLLAGAGAVVVKLTSSSADSGADRSAWESTVVAVCEASDRAADDQFAKARQVFYDGAHDPLHELAEQAAQRDRGVAARLLETKERVEAGLEAPTSELSEQLRQLAAHTRRAAQAVRDPVAAGCSREAT